MSFWLIALGLTAVVAVTLVMAMWRTRSVLQPAAQYDLDVYRRQLDEVERDLTRGVLNAEDAERTRAEIARRILEADRRVQEGETARGGPSKAATLGVAGGIAVVLIAVSLFVYADLGAPGYADQPLQDRLDFADIQRQNRQSQAEIEAALPPATPFETSPEHMALIEKLREVVASRPDDVRGLRLLVDNEARIGNFKAAYQAQEQSIAALGDQASAQDYAILADLMVLAAGGYVSPEAERALTRALELDPTNGVARYHLGALFAQVGRPDLTFQVWRRLLEQSTPDAPWLPPIYETIGDMAYFAGVDYTPPPLRGAGGLSGPSAEDMQAAADMTPEERQQMIRGMVEGLAERLATEGGSAPEWARLISALATLGETDRAREIWTEAQTVFAGTPDLDLVNTAAAQAGLSE